MTSISIPEQLLRYRRDAVMLQFSNEKEGNPPPHTYTPCLPTYPANIMHFSCCGTDFVLYGAYMHMDGLR